eukprot:COSAG04_NODE_2352_length_4286_cov_6.280153_6_plen_63_part_00
MRKKIRADEASEMPQVACGTYSYCAGSEGNQPVNHLSWDEVKPLPPRPSPPPTRRRRCPLLR